ncbi:MAG: glycosyltransferase family 1 protein, partial [Saprospiraceae bacterium]|nr:glycosyltransferase family 1 protein [Saprospiraceae bacterium]
ARIVTVSEFGRRDILAHYPELDPEKFDLACNGVKEQLAPLSEREKEAVRQEITGGHPYFFYLGAVHPRKNVDRLIRAFDRFK